MNTMSNYKYQELFQNIKAQIINGALKKNTKLDSIRMVSRKRDISTTTVEKAYLQLLVEGYVYSIPKSGYFVSDLEKLKSVSKQFKILPIPDKSYRNNALTSDMFDMKTYKSIVNKVINYYPEVLLQECAPNGEDILREEIRKYVLKERDVICDKNQIIIGPGIQNLLHILISLIDFDTISYLSPGFKKALSMFSLKGYQLFSHNHIDSLIKSNTDYLYISPSNIYPTGETLKIQDRIKLIKWAQQKNSYIIEDDYNFFIKYNNYTVPSIHSLDPAHVIYMGSFSKTLLPSMRISFMILPETLYKIYRKSYQTFSQGVSKLEQYTLAFYLKEGLFIRHTKKLYKLYKSKNQVFQKAILPYIEQNKIRIRGVESNLHVVIDFHSSEFMKQFIDSCQLKHYKYTVIEENKSILFPYSGIPNDKMKTQIDFLFNKKGNQ